MNSAFALEAEKVFEKTTALEKLKMIFIGKKIYIGHEKRPGWSGELPFYLFFCFSCGNAAKDYPHGYTNYLLCPHCDARTNLNPKDAYKPAE